MKLTKKQLMPMLEMAFLLGMLIWAVYSIGLVTRWWYLQQVIPNSWKAYYMAVLGVPNVRDWIYKDDVKYLFDWFLWFKDPFAAYMVYSGLQLGCYFILVHEVFKLRYGWLVVLIPAYVFVRPMMVGNVDLALSLAMINPVSATVAIRVKPQYSVFPALMVAMQYWEARRKKQDPPWYLSMWVTAIVLLAVMSLPTADAYRRADSNVLYRVDNLIFLLPAWYIFAKSYFKERP